MNDTGITKNGVMEKVAIYLIGFLVTLNLIINSWSHDSIVKIREDLAGLKVRVEAHEKRLEDLE